MCPARDGSDHGLLAICLHANGANVIAGDRAAGPLDVARENVSLYLRYVEELPAAVLAAAPTTLTSSTYTGKKVDVAGSGPPDSEAADAAVAPRLECRLGDGLAVLKEGEVDTVCVAGVGAFSARPRTSPPLPSWRASASNTVPSLYNKKPGILPAQARFRI